MEKLTRTELMEKRQEAWSEMKIKSDMVITEDKNLDHAYHVDGPTKAIINRKNKLKLQCAAAVSQVNAIDKEINKRFRNVK